MTKPKINEFYKHMEAYKKETGETEYKRFFHRGEETVYVISNKGNVYNVNTGRRLKPYIQYNGYYALRLKVANDSGKHFLIHRLVALAFIPNPEYKPEVNHINGNKLDNSVENLEWVTTEENKNHARINQLYTNKRYNTGFDNPMSKFSPETIEKICQLLATKKYRYREIAAMCNVSKSTVQEINNGTRYREISEKYHLHEDGAIKKAIERLLDSGEYIAEVIIDGCETNLYISNKGRVFNKENGLEVIPYYRKDYPFKAVAVRLADNRKMTTLVHTMVANAFLVNPNNYRYIIHRDGDDDNCNVENLMFGSFEQKLRSKKEPGCFKYA